MLPTEFLDMTLGDRSYPVVNVTPLSKVDVNANNRNNKIKNYKNKQTVVHKKAAFDNN
eukprot:Awhi_evm1s8477